MKLPNAYRIRRSAATVMGAGLVGLSAYFTWSSSHDLTAPIAAITGAAMLHFVETSWSEGQRLRAIAFAGLATLASLICLQNVLDRVSTAYDARLQGRQTENLSRVEAQKALATAEEEEKAAEAAASSKCSSTRGSPCKRMEERVEAARRRVGEARNELVRLGSATVEDPAARRLAAFLPWSEAQIGLALPFMLPAWLELSGLVLLTYGLAPRRKPKRQLPKVKARRKKKAPPQPSGPSQAKSIARASHLKVVSK